MDWTEIEKMAEATTKDALFCQAMLDLRKRISEIWDRVNEDAKYQPKAKTDPPPMFLKPEEPVKPKPPPLHYVTEGKDPRPKKKKR